jgi:hypothetical protein
MSASLVATFEQDRMRLPVLRSVLIAALIGNAVVNAVLQALVINSLIPPLTIIMALTLVVARVAYSGVGIDLRTDRPTPRAIRAASERLLREPAWKRSAVRLRDELSKYHPNELIEAYLCDASTRSCIGT